MVDLPALKEAAPPPVVLSSALDGLLRLALERNPRITAARERAAAAGELSVIDSALPDPKLMLGWYETPVQTRVGPQEWSLGIQQTIPFPSKLSTKSELGRTLARREVIAYERTVRDVLVEVVATAHELAYLADAVEITARIGELLERYAAAAAQGEAGTPLNELFRAETQRAQLANDKIVLEELRAAEEEHLRTLLALPPGTPVKTPRPASPPPVRASYSTLLEIATAHNQELKEAGLSVEAAQLRSSLARRDRLPDFTIGYTHIFTDALPGSVGNPVGNGEDAQILHVGFTLPVWAKSAGVRRAEALERAATRDRDATRLEIRNRLARAWYRVGNADRLARLYVEVLVPRAQTAARTAEDLHAAGKGTLAGTIETVAVYHNFRLAAARARADHGQAVATLEALLGRPLALEEGGTR